MKVLRRERASIVKRSLPDTKLPEDPTQLFLVSYFSGDLAEVVQSTSNIQREQIAGQVIVQSVADFIE